MTSRERVFARLRELGYGLGSKRMQRSAKIKIGGFFEWWTVGPNGEQLDRTRFKNGATYVGLNYMLDGMFDGGAQTTAWYIGLIDNAGFSGVSVNDTMASHAGWTEFTDYSGTDRATWGPSAAASGVMVNAVAFTFSITGSGTLAGALVTSVETNTPGNTGILWATALSTRAVTNGDTLSGIYGITLTPIS